MNLNYIINIVSTMNYILNVLFFTILVIGIMFYICYTGKIEKTDEQTKLEVGNKCFICVKITANLILIIIPMIVVDLILKIINK